MVVMNKDNELIADFEGIKKIKDLEKIDKDNEHLKDHYFLPKEEFPFWESDTLKYNKSLDWLLPVVDKCFDIFTIRKEKEGEYKFMGDHWYHFKQHRIVTTADTLIDAYYKGVVEYIKWFNDDESN
jgi:hypothetical protein